jgi:hypothetical protein
MEYGSVLEAVASLATGAWIPAWLTNAQHKLYRTLQPVA